MRCICLCLISLLFTPLLSAQNIEMRVATFNIRYDNPNDGLDVWDNRKEVLWKLIQFHDFDIFGVQEAEFHQLAFLEQQLDKYEYVGVGREDGAKKGEFTPVFYNKEKFKVLESDTFWLSEDTDTPNRGWDALLPRICTWAKIEVVGTRQQFYFFNTHFDHRGVEARKMSAALILEKIREIVPKDFPVILTGDFNAHRDEVPYQKLKDAPELNDAYEVADLVYANNGTTNSFDNTQSKERYIDHVFVSGEIKVEKYGILTDTYRNRYPSDHFPVVADIVWE